MSTPHLQSTNRTTGVLPGWSPSIFPCGLHGSRGKLLSVAISLSLGLFLVVSLNVSGTFLIVEEFSAASASQVAQVWGHSYEQLGQGAEEGEDTVPCPKGKRLRGTLASNKVEVNTLLVLLMTSLASSHLLIEDSGSGPRLLSANEPEPTKADAFPQELLSRPPPIK